MSTGITEIIYLAKHVWELGKRLQAVRNAPAQLEAIKQKTQSTVSIMHFFRSAYIDFERQASHESSSDKKKWKKRSKLANDIIKQFAKAIKDVDHVVRLVIQKGGHLRDRLMIQLRVAMKRNLLKVTCETMSFLLLQMSAFTSICNLHRDNMTAAAIKKRDQNANPPKYLLDSINHLENLIKDYTAQISLSYRKISRLVRTHDIEVGPQLKDMKKLKKKLDLSAKAVLGVESPRTDRRGSRSPKSSPKSCHPASATRPSSFYSFTGSELFEAKFDSNNRAFSEESPGRLPSTRASAASGFTPPSTVTRSSSHSSLPSTHLKSMRFFNFDNPPNGGSSRRSSSTQGSAGGYFSAGTDSTADSLPKEQEHHMKHRNLSEESILRRKRVKKKMKNGKLARPVAPYRASDADVSEDE